MPRTDTLIKKLENEKISKKEKSKVLDEFKQKSKRYESGDLIYFKNTAIPHCLEYYYNFYSQKLSSQSS